MAFTIDPKRDPFSDAELGAKAGTFTDAIAHGSTVTAAANAARLDLDEARKWVEDERIQEMITFAAGDEAVAIDARLSSLSDESLDTLARAMRDPHADAGQLIRAATAVNERVEAARAVLRQRASLKARAAAGNGWGHKSAVDLDEVRRIRAEAGAKDVGSGG